MVTGNSRFVVCVTFRCVKNTTSGDITEYYVKIIPPEMHLRFQFNTIPGTLPTITTMSMRIQITN